MANPPISALPSSVEITTACAPIATAIAAQLKAAGVSAQTVSSPTGEADCTILTDGFAAASTTARHWNALAAARQAKGTRTLLLQSAASADTSQTSGMAGLSRTLNAEWPGTSVQSLTLHTSAPNSVASIIQRALTLADVGHLISTPESFATTTLGPALSPPLQQQLQSANTWLVTGGGRGVTAACTIALAQRAGGTFLLAGRSPLIDWPNDIPRTHSQSELIGLIARHRPGNSPAQLRHIARTLLTSQEVNQTLDTIQAAGARAQYIALDVADGAAVATALQTLQSAHGPITGIIHGAGVLSDRRADDKTAIDFKTVFAPKVDGLLALLANLDLAVLSHIGVFSSASAIFGNPGQADYAAANDILGQIAIRLANDHPHLHARSFAWGPWEGGMVDAGLAAQFEDRGISLIPMQEGARIFTDQMLSRDPHPVQLCIGDDWTH